MPTPTQGLLVFRASRLEALLEPLRELMRAVPPTEVLAPHTLIAAHPGMRLWLSRALARREGPGGIAANIEVTLLSAWIDGLAQSVLGSAAVSLAPYSREALRWRIYEAVAHSDDAAVRDYLQGTDAPRRRYQLADRLAQLFTRYLVYRPDWLAAWAAGRHNVPEVNFLASLWRGLQEQVTLPHRGERLQALLRALGQTPGARMPSEPLHLFGLNHLPPTELAILRAIAKHRPVALYLADPCREYWAGLKPEPVRLRQLAQLDAFSEDAERAFLAEVTHPLLARWGRLGQHLMLALAEESEVAADIRHGLDERAPPTRVPLLARVQESLRQFDTRLVAESSDTPPLHDRSLRIHACHTRLRELEVLRDALLREREAHPDLKPGEIVVMAPDIRAYVPLLPAVFGAAGAQGGPLPYHLADVPLAHSHPLLLAFQRLLDVPTSRLSADEVLDFLAVPEIARALRLDAADVDVLGGWLAQSRVAWALDGEFRAQFDVPPIAEYSFAWGMDRLMAGYVFGQESADDEAFRFADGTPLVPVGNVQGPQAESLGALDRLLQALAALHREARTPRRVSEGVARLRHWIDTLFRAAPQDFAAEHALKRLRGALEEITRHTDDAQVDPIVEWSVLREAVRERLALVTESAPFSIGAITFCGMVPQRAIPFRVVAVLGLNDGEFPRHESGGGIDLMQAHRRLGDRDVRSDDRYLFLETLMAARDALHLSYLGEGVRDGKPRNPAAPLADLMAFLDEYSALADRPWWVRHPLQPFDARYFDGEDPRLFSYRADWLALSRNAGGRIAPFVDHSAMTNFEDVVDAPLSEVLAYYRDPAKQVLRGRLGLRLSALEATRLGDREPLLAQFERIEGVSRRLLLKALERGETGMPNAPPDWLRHGGLWPAGAAGERAWRQEAELLQPLLERALSEPLLRGGLPAHSPFRVDAVLGTVRVQGELGRLFERDGVRWLFDAFPGKAESDLGFRERIGVFLEWALALLYARPSTPLRVLLLTSGNDTPWQNALNALAGQIDAARTRGQSAMLDALLADIERRATALLAQWAQAQTRPTWYFPRTSWAATQIDTSPDKVSYIWHGGFGKQGERDYAPGYTQLLAGDARFEADEDDFARLHDVARSLHALIHFDAGATE